MIVVGYDQYWFVVGDEYEVVCDGGDVVFDGCCCFCGCVGGVGQDLDCGFDIGCGQLVLYRLVVFGKGCIDVYYFMIFIWQWCLVGCC